MRTLVFCLIISVIIISCSKNHECSNNDYSYLSESYPIYLTDLYSYYPMHFGLSTYVDSIDNYLLGRTFKNLKPSHNYIFENCNDAITKANRDFESGKPSIIQFNGITGKFPSINEMFSEKLGVYVNNTGCYSYEFSECYNDQIINLLSNRFRKNSILGLQHLDSLNRRAVIDLETDQVKVVDVMPKITNFNDTISLPLLIGGDSLRCKYKYLLIGRFTMLIPKKGKATVLNYEEGSLDCDCVNRMSKYLENSSWNSAIVNGDTLDAVVEIQLMN